MRSFRVAFLVVMAAGLPPGVAYSDSITVPNYSFENTLGFTATGGAGVGQGIVEGNWLYQTSNPVDVAGTQDQSVSPGNPVGTDGNNWAFLNLSGPGGTTYGMITSAATVTTIAPSTTYDLTVSVGENVQTGGYDLSGNFTVSLLANGVAIATSPVQLGVDLTKGAFTDISTSFTSPASGGVDGQNLTIQLYSVADGRGNIPPELGGEQSLFDNVRLSANPVPEPSTVVLGGLGVATLLIAARRRMKR